MPKTLPISTLRKHGACEVQVLKAEEIFGQEIPLTMTSWRKARKAKLDWEWLSRLLPQPAYKEYKKIQQPAWEEYLKIQQSAYKEYRKMPQPAWEEYLKIQQPARKEYKKACALELIRLLGNLTS